MWKPWKKKNDYDDYDEYEPQRKSGGSFKIFKYGSVVLVGICLVASMVSVIDTGERGVVLRLGKYTGTMDEGLNGKAPFIDRVVKMNVRDVNYPVETEVSSKDMQSIKVKVSLLYALDPKAVGSIYQKYGTNYETTLIKPTMLEIINSVIANYPIEEFVEKRSEISSKINQAFVDKTASSGVQVKSLLITDHDFSDEFNKAIENKKVAEQGALKAKYDLERVTLEAEAQTRKQKSLSPMVLQEKAIDKWDGKLPQYFSGEQLPFLTIK